MAQYERFGNWTLRFAEGERAERLASGEWTGLTLADHVARRAATTPGRVAIRDEQGGLSDGEANDRGAALARSLTAMGLAPGDTVAFQLPNWTEAAVIDVACALGGFVVAPIIPIYRQAELRFILRDCRARVLFIPGIYRGTDYPALISEVRADAPELAHVITLRGAECGLDRLIAKGRGLDLPLPGSEPDAAKLIIYTSGTTGEPKGVIYSHNQGSRSTGQSFAAWKMAEGTRLLMPSPVTHVTGFFYGIEAAFTFGSETLLMERWDAAEAVRLIDRDGTRLMVGATPFLSELVEAAGRAGSRLPSLQIFACGGAAVPPDLIRRADAAFPACRSFRVYGSSETPMITQGVLDDRNLAATTDGRIHDWEVKIVDEAGLALPPGQEGEVLARGPALFRGYTKRAADDAAFDDQGYFRTGDLGVVDARGIITITGRKKDLIIRGGENLSAKEIEDALYRHPAIREVAVVAFPHPRMGEGVAACLVASGTARPALDDLAEFLKDLGLARQKWPEQVVWLDELPKTASGKVKKHLLRDQFPVG